MESRGMIVVDVHASEQDPLVSNIQPPPQLDVAVRRQDRIEPACGRKRRTAVGTVPTVDIGRSRKVTFGRRVDVPGPERLVVVNPAP